MIKIKRLGLSFLLLASLVLTGCEVNSNAIKVERNIDYLLMQEDESTSPITIYGDEFLKFRENKMDFALFFYSDSCSHCTNLKNWFPDILKNKPYNIYQMSASISDLTYIQGLYPDDDLFAYTPQVMFFEKGEIKINMNSSRFNSYSSFESSLSSFATLSNIYTCQKLASLEYFFANNDEYFIYLENLDSSYDGDGGIFEVSSLSFYSESIYPYLKDSKKSSLVLNLNLLEDEAKNYIYDKFNLDVDIKTYAIYSKTNKNETSNSTLEVIYNYSDEGMKAEITSFLAQNF